MKKKQQVITWKYGVSIYKHIHFMIQQTLLLQKLITMIKIDDASNMKQYIRDMILRSFVILKHISTTVLILSSSFFFKKIKFYFILFYLIHCWGI